MPPVVILLFYAVSEVQYGHARRVSPEGGTDCAVHVVRSAMMERDDADDLGRALVDELMTGVDWIIYDKYLQRQLVPYTVHAAINHALQIIDVCSQYNISLTSEHCKAPALY